MLLQHPLPFTVLKPKERPFSNTTWSPSSCNIPYRLRYWNSSRDSAMTIWHHFKVATSLTVYGIETWTNLNRHDTFFKRVATSLTVYGIETCKSSKFCRYHCIELQHPLPFTVLKLARISHDVVHYIIHCVATSLTVYGIETKRQLRLLLTDLFQGCNIPYRLRYWNYWLTVSTYLFYLMTLQHPLPFTVLKLIKVMLMHLPRRSRVATSLTVYGIETINNKSSIMFSTLGCNIPYRLRYWNKK